MEQKKKHIAGRIILGVLAAAVTAALVAAPFILEKRNQSGENKASIFSDTARVGTVSKVLSGTGTLTDEESVSVTVPSGVQITEYLVSNGDMVEKGQPVAVVDKTSVMRAISDVNDTLSRLDEQITAASDTKAEEYITAKAAGRLKAVYAEKGDSVRDVVTRYGALAVVSMDGKMAADVPAGTLVMGQSVFVTLPSGKSVSGRVDSVREGTAVVTIDDQYGEIGDIVSLRDAEGGDLGESILYVHSPWKAIAYTGTVAGVYLKEGKTAAAGANLFRLRSTGDSGKYDQLTARRREYEDIAYELFLLYQDGVVTSPCDGRVSGADDSLLKQLSAGNGGYTVVLLSANTPPDNGESEYHNRVGVITAVNDDGTVTAGLMFETEILDYGDLSGLLLDTSRMTKEVTFTPGIIYQNTGTDKDGIAHWETRYGVEQGDLYVFTYDSDLAWMIYVGHVDIPEPTPAPTPRPTQAPEPTPGTSPGGGSQGRTDSGSAQGKPDSGGTQGRPDGNGKTQGGGMPGGATIPTNPAAEEEEELYSRTGTTILSVTPQDAVTVSITVDELDILSVRTGQEVSVTVDALPCQSFVGEITDVNTTASNEGGNSKYTVEITMDRTEKMLGGMNASAKITLQTKENVLTVPTEALSEGETETVVYTAWDASSETLLSPVTVKTGLSDGQRTEIHSGLSEGETIWYAYYDKLPDAGLPQGLPG